MIATVLKIQEWNSDGKNHGFLFKQIGETYPGLEEDDFAIGYMNAIMEKKLRDFPKIICIDGTNRRNWDLTIVLIRDEQNMGFPVAFLLSNRLDQLIQEVFFRALKTRLGEAVQAEYIMSDDDPKYNNAWIMAMDAEHKPRRLLCTWHIVKNWNIQGRSKIKKLENRQIMKHEMRKILKGTDPQNFIQLKENYFRQLEEEEETNFQNYLKNQERIMMWAHCYRINAGINTNMAVESLNKVLKYNKMNGKQNIRIEKLLDLLDDLVDERMWKRIINMERPNANNYQHKICQSAHKKAEEMVGNNGNVSYSELGHFKARSFSDNHKLYCVNYNEVCDEDCRAMYCEKCKICKHKYNGDCPDYTVKSVMCKHIHAVALFEQRSEYVSGFMDEMQEDNNLYVNEPSTSKTVYENEVNYFLDETENRMNVTIDFERKREICLEQFCSEIRNYGGGLGEHDLEKFMGDFRNFMQTVKQKEMVMSKKRKIEKQQYYLNEKPK
ncbi:uncharacterized protein LOC126746948 isoform X2 [Anthonomus grandis grandis]|uniref:uncharacterized protein LOC126746948 isoform X2 n=1 Tax=Anthonomus grandis grandis TaxID=2921223 RepID=UPI0021650EEF|nr:uncharacterized protein LOC126746948 isoform X2 [Anthonomus grandis grandis]